MRESPLQLRKVKMELPRIRISKPSAFVWWYDRVVESYEVKSGHLLENSVGQLGRMVLGYARAVDCLVGFVAPWHAMASCVLLPSAADRLPFPFKTLTQTPQMTLVIAGVGYLAFLILFLPLYAISFIVTATGAWFVLVGGVYLGGRTLTQTISYPGASKQIQRDIELEYTKSVSVRLISFANNMRLFLQLARDVTVVPSGMGHFRALHEDLRESACRGNIWVLMRALEELTALANMPTEEAGARAGAVNASAAVAAAAAAAGANTLAPSAIVEAEALLECLADLLPILEEALGMTSKMLRCVNTHEFSRERQSLLVPGVEKNNRFAMIFTSMEGTTTKLMKLARQLKSRRKKPVAATNSAAASATSGTPTAGAAADGRSEEEGVGGGEVGNDEEDDAIPTEEEGTPKASGFPGSIVKSWWNSRYPYEGAAGFGLMREEMLIKSNAQQVWLAMSDGTQLDCCYARANGSRRDGGGGDGGQGDERSSTGCVLFCNPNAGYYETMVMAGDGCRNWVSFYTSVGCDVFLFNYRGFGRSKGRASPAKIGKDAKEVVAYLREQLGVTRLAVHGESIGGVAAASVARHCQVDLLVLDRTFSSLSAVAQRLMGGWTKWAIWGFTGWEADVAADYLACDCYKVLACDPEDAMIADASSAKAGVSVMVELGISASSLDVYQPPASYKVADHTRSCPPIERMSLPLSPQERLTDIQIAHFTACLRYIGRQAPRVGQSSVMSPLGARGRRRRRRGDLPINAYPPGSSPRDVEMVSLGEDSGVNREEAGEGQDDGDASPQPDPLTEGQVDVSKPLGELWMLLAKTDGLCGRMLGRAVSKGFDDVRAWACSLVVLGPVVRTDAIAMAGQQAISTGSLSLESVSQRVQTLLKEHPDELGSNPFVEFVSWMLIYFTHRISEGVAHPPSSIPSDQAFKSSRANNSGVGTGAADGFFSGTGVRGGSRGGTNEGLGRGHGRAAIGDESSALDTLEGGMADAEGRYGVEFVAVGGSRADATLGRVLPLHCGHNNAYSDDERRMLFEHLALEGWVAPDRKRLEDVTGGTRARQ